MSNQQFFGRKIKRMVETVFAFSLWHFGRTILIALFFFLSLSLSVKCRKKPLSFILDRLNEDVGGRKAQTKTKENFH